ncbi:hypothetical protein [Anabaenopsis elenkinii]|uniref:Uncharacterized protein n=1 Tax=Anabaenopsis elenkinii CCIBt3563 TaxID=2779889 RepID=A0A7S6RD87_9CYAN|nr:hypothetical protein [Anabaenopsis elenkinii]QOV22127.1 hypothetical protein IM676_15740 [Anabaenopsis elenkinii CCIBt3563]
MSRALVSKKSMGYHGSRAVALGTIFLLFQILVRQSWDLRLSVYDLLG